MVTKIMTDSEAVRRMMENLMKKHTMAEKPRDGDLESGGGTGTQQA